MASARKPLNETPAAPAGQPASPFTALPPVAPGQRAFVHPDAPGLPDDYPRDMSGRPIPMEDLDDDVREVMFQKYGGMDIESIRSNNSLGQRMEDVAAGQATSNKRWGTSSEGKYDALMARVGGNQNARVYLTRTKPSPHKYTSPPASLVPTFADLYAWFKDKEWDGQEAVVQWQVRDGSVQVGTDYLPLAYDPFVHASYQARVRALSPQGGGMHAQGYASQGYTSQGYPGPQLGTPPSWGQPPAPLPAAPVPQAAPAPAPAPPPVVAQSGMTPGQVQAMLAAERQGWERERDALMAAERAKFEAQTLRSQMEALRSSHQQATEQGYRPDPRLAAEFERLSGQYSTLSAQMAAMGQVAPLPPPQSSPPAHSQWAGQHGPGRGGYVEQQAQPRPALPPPPPGYRLVYDQNMQPEWIALPGGPGAMPNTPHPITPLQPVAQQQQQPAAPLRPFGGIEDAVRTVIGARDAVFDASTKLGFPGPGSMFPQLGSFPAQPGGGLGSLPAQHGGALAFETALATVPTATAEEPKPKGITNYAGLNFRTDEKGGIKDDIGLMDVALNAEGIGGVASFFLTKLGEREAAQLEADKARSQLAREAIENEERKFEVQRKRAMLQEELMAKAPPAFHQPEPTYASPDEAMVASPDPVEG